MASRPISGEQLAAIEAPGLVFVSAGAGTGKTTVLVERYTRALCERGLSVDSLLVITYTERAAGELRGRIRARLVELGRPDLARELDGAWISTIHGFCLRLLKAHPFAAGLDPRFRVLDESQGRVLRSEAFEEALSGFCSEGEPERLRLLATYGAGGLRRMLTGVYETLRAADRPLRLELAEAPAGVVEAAERLRDAARCVLADAGTAARGRERAERALELLLEPPDPELLLDLSELSSRGERFASYEEARRSLEGAALDALARRDSLLLEALLQRFDGAYRAAKERESALDFEDLQLLARNLLRDHEAIRERERWRFRSIMVDEFQDTNRLQCELVDLLAGEELFFVGDEFQSIYGFRHADVDVFRERRARSGGVLALTQNFRSRPEVLEAINHLFSADFGESYRPLAAAGRFDDPAFGPAVELLVTDKASFAAGELHWRRAEARHIAGRVRELVDAGAATPGEIVLLFAAGTDAEWYEEELRALGLPTHRSTGRGYFGQQQVVDLLAYLRLLQNRYDDEALVAVLASPLVGVSNDALVLLRRAAPKRPLFTGLERGLPPSLYPRDTRRFRAFLQRFERISGQVSGLSLERLCETIVAEHDYDLAALARWDGRRRYANLRKLARLARSFEELRGRDIEGFVRFVAEQEALGARELEAVAEEEGADAIRLLTIHAAKGLEFKVVVVADAGRDRAGPAPDEILCLPDGRLGFRVADPSTGKRLAASGYEGVKEAERLAEEAERRRLYYVAMTRAIDRLIVSGAIDPEREADASTPIGWVLGRLGTEELRAAEGGGPVEVSRGEARIVVRVNHGTEAVHAGREDEAGLQLALFEPGEGGREPGFVPPLPLLAPVPAAPAERVRRLSFSALALYERCSYRFYAERIVGLPERDAAAAPGSEGPGLAATEIGDAVHAVLERLDLRRPEPPEPEALAAAVRSRHPRASGEEVDRVAAFVGAYCGSALAQRLSSLEDVRVERSFAFEHDGVLLHGRLDVLHFADGAALVVDYKTNRVGEETPAAIVDEGYGLQRLVYALVLLRAGAEVVEVAYLFLERPEEPVLHRFDRTALPALEAELSAAIARIHAGGFRPTPSDHACVGCPALDLVCAGPRLRGAQAADPAPRALASVS